MPLPKFDVNETLPAGDYALTIDELRLSHLVSGDGSGSPSWDRAWRAYLVSMLEILVSQLWQVGIDQIFVNGSFVENKDHPSDVDGYFVCEKRAFVTGQLHAQLNGIDPYKVWTWDHNQRRIDTRSGKLQLPMWHRYHVEFYPHFGGNTSGIRDRFGNSLEFPAAFRQSKASGLPKGIVQILRANG